MLVPWALLTHALRISFSAWRGFSKCLKQRQLPTWGEFLLLAVIWFLTQLSTKLNFTGSLFHVKSPGHKLSLWRTRWWSEVLLLSLSWEHTFSRHITIYSVHNLLPHVTALKLPDFKQGWISQWRPAMLWRCASQEEGSGWFPGTSSSRQAWLPEQTVWLLRGGVGSREAKPQTGAASADTGHTQNQRPGLPQPHQAETFSRRAAQVGSRATNSIFYRQDSACEPCPTHSS